jgi:hypothetical protein
MRGVFMKEEDFLKLLNAVVRIAKPFHKEAPDIDDMNMQFADTTIDSLDMLLVGLYMADVFGISDEDAKNIMAKTPAELFEIIKKIAQKFPEDIDQAIADLK